MQIKLYYGDFDSVTQQISNDNAAIRIDIHFNASENIEDNYSMCLVRDTAEYSQHIADTLVFETANKLGIENRGTVKLSRGERGHILVRSTKCPTILYEPCFVSNPDGANVAKNHRNLLSDALIATLKKHMADGSLVAIVPGHAHKQTNDMGANVHGGGSEGQYTELLAKELETKINEPVVHTKEMIQVPDIRFTLNKMKQVGTDSFVITHWLLVWFVVLIILRKIYR